MIGSEKLDELIDGLMDLRIMNNSTWSSTDTDDDQSRYRDGMFLFPTSSTWVWLLMLKNYFKKLKQKPRLLLLLWLQKTSAVH